MGGKTALQLGRTPPESWVVRRHNTHTSTKMSSTCASRSWSFPSQRRPLLLSLMPRQSFCGNCFPASKTQLCTWSPHAHLGFFLWSDILGVGLACDITCSQRAHLYWVCTGCVTPAHEEVRTRSHCSSTSSAAEDVLDRVSCVHCWGPAGTSPTHPGPGAAELTASFQISGSCVLPSLSS